MYCPIVNKMLTGIANDVSSPESQERVDFVILYCIKYFMVFNLGYYAYFKKCTRNALMYFVLVYVS